VGTAQVLIHISSTSLHMSDEWRHYRTSCYASELRRPKATNSLIFGRIGAKLFVRRLWPCQSRLDCNVNENVATGFVNFNGYTSSDSLQVRNNAFCSTDATFSLQWVVAISQWQRDAPTLQTRVKNRHDHLHGLHRVPTAAARLC
jgi:hypothetical protein